MPGCCSRRVGQRGASAGPVPPPIAPECVRGSLTGSASNPRPGARAIAVALRCVSSGGLKGSHPQPPGAVHLPSPPPDPSPGFPPHQPQPVSWWRHGPPHRRAGGILRRKHRAKPWACLPFPARRRASGEAGADSSCRRICIGARSLTHLGTFIDPPFRGAGRGKRQPRRTARHTVSGPPTPPHTTG